MTTMTKDYLGARQKKLISQIKRIGAEALLVTSETNVTYLTGFSGDSSYLLIGKDQTVLISDGRYTTQLEEECPGLDVHIRKPTESMIVALEQVLKKSHLTKVGLESHVVTCDLLDALTGITPAIQWNPVSNVVEELRMVKDASEIQEIREAVDQAQREIANRFDFKNTNSTIEQNDMVITLHTVSEDRMNALRTVLEEKLVKRGVSLRGVDYGDVQEATQNTVRQVVTIKVGISSDKSKEINKLIKANAPKGTSSQTQGESIRVSAKKRDALQDVIAMLKAEDVGIPLQFQNFRD